MSKNIEQLVEELSGLSVLDMAKLKEMLEAKWGVKAQAAVAMAAPVAQAQEGAAAKEATDFLVTLEAVDETKKIAVIKVVREITGLGLKEAKDMCEAAPKVVKETAPKAEAEDLKKKLEAVGAKVSLKPL